MAKRGTALMVGVGVVLLLLAVATVFIDEPLRSYDRTENEPQPEGLHGAHRFPGFPSHRILDRAGGRATRAHRPA